MVEVLGSGTALAVIVAAREDIEPALVGLKLACFHSGDGGVVGGGLNEISAADFELSVVLIRVPKRP